MRVERTFNSLNRWEVENGIATSHLVSTDVTKNSEQLLGDSGADPTSGVRGTEEAAAVRGQFWLNEVTGREGSLTSERRTWVTEM